MAPDVINPPSDTDRGSERRPRGLGGRAWDLTSHLVGDGPQQRKWSPMQPRFRTASMLGALMATVVFIGVVSIGSAELVAAPTGDFYDLQAEAWLAGQWHIDDQVNPTTGVVYSPLSIEAFVVDGRSHMYYGPIPAVFRLPVQLFADEYHGRFTQVSLLAAFVAVMVAFSRLSWRVRTLVRGDDLVQGREDLVTVLFTLSVGAGSVLLFLGSQPTVYHEALLWSVAFAIAAYRAIIDVAVYPSRVGAAKAGFFIGMAILTRASVGLGPVLALALVGAVHAVRGHLETKRFAEVAEEREREALTGRLPIPGEVRAEPGPRPSAPSRHLGAIVAALLIPLTLYAGVNMARFGNPFDLPMDKQVFSQPDCACFNEQRLAALEANGGSLFGFGNIPSTLLAYSRPDAIEIEALPPFFNFPREQPSVVGDAVFDVRDETSSWPASMPLLTILALVGLLTVVRPPPASEARLVWATLVGATVSAVPVLTIAFIANRYLADLLPLVLVLALVGFHRCGRSFGGDLTPMSIVVATLFVVTGGWSLAANIGLSLEYQRLIAPVELQTRDDFVALQYSNGSTHRVSDLPLESIENVPVGERGNLILAGTPCRVWWTDGFAWIPLDGIDGGDPAGTFCFALRLTMADVGETTDTDPNPGVEPDLDPAVSGDSTPTPALVTTTSN